LCRYVELNPVRAGVVATTGAWPWSSYRAHVGDAESPEWLDTAGLHAYLLGRPAVSAADHRRAARRYAELVASAPAGSPWEQGLNRQIYLGDARFVAAMQALAESRRRASAEVPRAQRNAPRDLRHWLASQPTREAALLHAHRDGGLSMTAIARELGLSVARVSQLIARAERAA
jgi:DNA-directed RNA polymerase specialized sigma24 family protein